MKTTTVPAQVTTVEDKIAGNLSMSQLILLAAPLFFGGLLYVLLPPTMQFTPLKVIFSTLTSLVFAALAVRIRGVLILTWLNLKLRYNLRPRYYVCNKNSGYLRHSKAVIIPLATDITAAAVGAVLPELRVGLPERVRLENAIANPRANFHLIAARKGGLRVHITEVKQEG